MGQCVCTQRASAGTVQRCSTRALGLGRCRWLHTTPPRRGLLLARALFRLRGGGRSTAPATPSSPFPLQEVFAPLRAQPKLRELVDNIQVGPGPRGRGGRRGSAVAGSWPRRGLGDGAVGWQERGKRYSKGGWGVRGGRARLRARVPAGTCPRLAVGSATREAKRAGRRPLVSQCASGPLALPSGCMRRAAPHCPLHTHALTGGG